MNSLFQDRTPDLLGKPSRQGRHIGKIVDNHDKIVPPGTTYFELPWPSDWGFLRQIKPGLQPETKA